MDSNRGLLALARFQDGNDMMIPRYFGDRSFKRVLGELQTFYLGKWGSNRTFSG